LTKKIKRCDVTQVLRTEFAPVPGRKKKKKFFFLIQTMSLASGVVNNPAIDSLVQSSLENDYDDLRLKWIPCSQITDIEPTQINNVYCAILIYDDYDDDEITLVLLGNDEICTSTL